MLIIVGLLLRAQVSKGLTNLNVLDRGQNKDLLSHKDGILVTVVLQISLHSLPEVLYLF